MILETPQIDDINSGDVSIELVDDETGAVLSRAPLYRCANRLIGSLMYPEATVRYRIAGSDINGQPFNSLSTNTERFVQASFEVEVYGGNPVEVEEGHTIALNLTVHNPHDNEAHYTFTPEPVPGFVQAFRPVDLKVPRGRSGSVKMIVVPIHAGPGLYTFTANITGGCVVHSVSKDVLIEEVVRVPYTLIILDQCHIIHTGHNSSTCH